MAQHYAIQSRSMASRWRRRRMCVLHADGPSPAALEDVSGRGATVRSNRAPDCGAMVTLVHPAAGPIDATVHAVSETGIELRFAGNEDSIAFALTAIASDMTRAG